MVGRKRSETTDTEDPRIFNPSPEEIRRGCELIRAGWSDRMFQKRGWRRTVPFSWPRVSDQELIEAIEETEQDASSEA